MYIGLLANYELKPTTVYDGGSLWTAYVPDGIWRICMYMVSHAWVLSEILWHFVPETSFGPRKWIFSTFSYLFHQHRINLTGFFFTHGLRILYSIDWHRKKKIKKSPRYILPGDLSAFLLLHYTLQNVLHYTYLVEADWISKHLESGAHFPGEKGVVSL